MPLKSQYWQCQPGVAEKSLAALRARAAALGGESALGELAEALRRDGRAGARALADRCERRVAALRRERARLAFLFETRRQLRERGVRLVAGVDEAGVGPLAGPVVAAAVVLPDDPELPGLDDSKKLAPAIRERLADAIRCQAIDWAVGEAWPEEIDRLNIYRASLLSMRRAVEGLSRDPDHVLVDARTIPGIRAPQTSLVRGDLTLLPDRVELIQEEHAVPPLPRPRSSPRCTATRSCCASTPATRTTASPATRGTPRPSTSRRCGGSGRRRCTDAPLRRWLSSAREKRLADSPPPAGSLAPGRTFYPLPGGVGEPSRRTMSREGPTRRCSR